MKAQNKAGTWFSLIEKENGNFLVYKLCANHAAHVKGGIAYKWRCDQPTQRMSNAEFQAMVSEGMPKAEAEALFNKRLKGKQK